MNNKKRKRSDSDVSDNASQSSADRPKSKYSRTVELNAIDANTTNIENVLRQMASNFVEVAREANQDPTVTRQDARMNEIRNQFQNIFNEAFSEMLTSTLSASSSSASASSKMTSEEYHEREDIKERFVARLRPLSELIRDELTVAQQVQMFDFMIRMMNERLDQAELNNREIDQMSRLSEIAGIMYNYAMTSLAVNVTNVYNSSVEKTRQLIALLVASGMIFNYLPEGVRQLFENLPYLGPMFTIMNRTNPEALLVQNSAATVTTIFYLLRNSGVDPTPAIRAVGAFATEVSTMCVRQTGQLVCSGITGSISRLQQGATTLMNNLTDILGNILTSPYQNVNLMSESQDTESVSSLNSFSSSRIVDLDSKSDSSKTEASVKSIDSLLNTSVFNGGINIVGTLTPPEIVDERFNAITSDPSNPIISLNVEHTEDIHPDAQIGSQETNISDISSESFGWQEWFYKHGTVGGKFRKRRRIGTRKRRQTKSHKRVKKHGRKSAKGRKGRKGRKTMKR